METLRVMIADDDNMVRFGLRGYIEAEEGLEVVAEASSGRQAIELARAHNPNVVILDVRMPDVSGVEACRAIRDQNPDIKVIMLTAHEGDEALFDSIMAGAAGYLIKGVPREDLIRSVRRVGEGESLLDSAMTEKVFERMRHPKSEVIDPRLAALSPTEERVLDLVAEGLTNRQIATRIHMPETTVKNNVSSMMRKLDVSRRSGAAAYFTKSQADNDKTE